MPATFTLPADTQAPFAGNPAGDMNNAIDAHKAMGATFNVCNAAYAGGADPGTISTPGAESTAAFAACIAAATAASGEVVIPPGNYTLNVPAGGIPLTGPVRIRGLGTGLVVFGGALRTGVTLNCNGGSGGTTSLFTFPYQGYLWAGLEVSGIGISYTGTGNVFHLLNIGDSVFRDMNITLTAAGSMAFYTTGSVSSLNLLYERLHIITTAAVRTNPPVSISSSIGAGISNNTWYKCRFTNAGLDNTQYMLFYQCTGTGSAYHFADNLRDCWFEHPFGGVYKSLSGSNVIVDGCMVWDVQGGQGQTVGNSLYYFGAAASNAGSQTTRVTGCGRNLNGPDGASTWDVYCEASTSNIHVEGYSTSPLNPNTTYNVFFNFNGCQDVVLINNQSPQGAAVNGNSTTVVTNPGGEQIAITNGTILPDPPGTWTPRDSNYLAWTYDPAQSISGKAPTSGVVQVLGLKVRTRIPVTNIVMYISAVPTGALNSGQNWAGLYTAAGTQIGLSADQTTPWATTGIKTMALGGGPYTLDPGNYFIVFVSNVASLACPQFARLADFNATLTNLNLGTGAKRAATNGTGTTLPTPLVPANNVDAQNIYFAALS